MGIYPNRRRQARLNDPDREAKPKWYEVEETKTDEEDLELDYSGVVESDEEKVQERQKKMKKSVGGGGGLDLDFEEFYEGDGEEDPDIEFSYEGITRSAEEKKREKDAEAIGEAVASALEQRGVLAGEDDEDDRDIVKKDADPWDNLSKEAEELATMVQEFVKDRRDAAT